LDLSVHLPCHLLALQRTHYPRSEDGGSILLRNVDIHLQQGSPEGYNITITKLK
jgi:hypothetical protein